ncbi:hypothetical protein NLI96_g3543 [Meripilus lineatus]|uniref:histone deacetylase n=1 Tax=Meripilus lineatus TaxID=2056292 RepID=A0AAD5V6P8_9APHY|nr:hypothetical protein NLI96_g3543 [Physisporinus lineatus]
MHSPFSYALCQQSIRQSSKLLLILKGPHTTLASGSLVSRSDPCFNTPNKAGEMGEDLGLHTSGLPSSTDVVMREASGPATTSVVPPSSTIPNPMDSRLYTATVGFVYDNQMMLHSCIRGHAEAPERISRIFDALKEAQCLSKMSQIPIRMVQREEALLVHSESLWDKVIAVSSMTAQDIADSEAYYEELSLYVHPNTPLSARLSCGGVIEAALAVARGLLRKSFAISQSTGNGTQRAFNEDPSVLYISLHRYDGGQFYPNGPFGSMSSCGDGPGLGYSVNIPWPEGGMGDADYLYAFQSIVMPIAMEFAPELVIISAGFDAADGDDLGECHVSPEGYAHMTHMLSSLAGGRLVVALEGGYNLDAISASALAVAKVILGEIPPELPSMVASDIATETVWQVATEQSKYWKSINPKACEPIEEVENVAFNLTEVLKAHRQQWFYDNYKMLQIPFPTQILQERFGSQVICTPNIMDAQTLVVMVHEFGNLRVELESVMQCIPHLEHTYIVDYSKQLTDWVNGAGHALLDVNVYPKLPAKKPGDRQEFSKDVMVYLWDNYIQLSGARHVVLIGHGPGCDAVMSVLHNRATGVMKSVRAIVQVVGHGHIPLTPRDANEIRSWYLDHSCVVVPSNHTIFVDGKVLKRHGNVLRIDEPKPIKLITRAFPTICEFIERMLTPPSRGNVNGST